MPDGGGEPVLRSVGVQVAPALPNYLVRHYRWAYLRPTSLRIFDRPLVVSAILWGQYRRDTNADGEIDAEELAAAIESGALPSME